MACRVGVEALWVKIEPEFATLRRCWNFLKFFVLMGDRNPHAFTEGIFKLMSELMSGIFVLESREFSSESESASVRESPRDIQPLEFAEIFTDSPELDFASFHRRDRRDELPVTVASARNIDVFSVLQAARERFC